MTSETIHPLLLDGLTFNITDTWEECLEWFSSIPEYKSELHRLDEPSGLTKVDLCSRHFTHTLDIRYRTVDFSGTTVKQAIQKILQFYKHKTYRREVGDHIFFECFEIYKDIPRNPRIWLGS